MAAIFLRREECAITRCATDDFITFLADGAYVLSLRSRRHLFAYLNVDAGEDPAGNLPIPAGAYRLRQQPSAALYNRQIRQL